MTSVTVCRPLGRAAFPRMVIKVRSLAQARFNLSLLRGMITESQCISISERSSFVHPERITWTAPRQRGEAKQQKTKQKRLQRLHSSMGGLRTSCSRLTIRQAAAKGPRQVDRPIRTAVIRANPKAPRLDCAPSQSSALAASGQRSNVLVIPWALNVCLAGELLAPRVAIVDQAWSRVEASRHSSNR